MNKRADEKPQQAQAQREQWRERIERLRDLARGHDYAEAKELAEGAEAIEDVFAALDAAVAQGQAQALLAAADCPGGEYDVREDAGFEADHPDDQPPTRQPEPIALVCVYCGTALTINTETVGPAYLTYERPESIECDALDCGAVWEPDGTPRDVPPWVGYPGLYPIPDRVAQRAGHTTTPQETQR
jgi:hypothetical protein